MPLPADAIPLNNSNSLPSDAVPINQMQSEDDYEEPKSINSNVSPLTAVDSIKYSILQGDTEGQAKLLKSKFPYVQQTPQGIMAGNSPQDAQPVTPSWFADPLTRLAQSVGDIPIIAGSIIGGGLGSLEAGIGAIPGSAAGGAAGTLINKGIGKLMGINQQNAESIAVDTVLNGVGMGVAEAGGMLINNALKAASQTGLGVAKKGLQMFEKNVANGTIDASKAEAAKGLIKKVVRFTTATDEDWTGVALNNGVNKTLVADETGIFTGIKKGSDEYLGKLAQDINDKVNTTKEQLGFDLGKKSEAFQESAKGRRLFVDTPDLQANIFTQAKLAKLGDITTVEQGIGKPPLVQFTPYQRLDSESSVMLGKLRNYFQDLGGDVKEINLPGGKKGWYMQLNSEAQADIGILNKNYGELDRAIEAAPDKVKTRLIPILHGNENPAFGPSVKGITDAIGDMAANSGEIGSDYLTAKTKFREFMNTVDGVSKFGLDLKNLSSIESKIKGGLIKDPLLTDAVMKLDNKMGTNYANLIPMWKSANVLSNTNPNYLRFGLVLAMTGLSGMNLPEPVKIAGGLMLASPFGAATTLKSLEKTGILGKMIGKETTEGLAKGITSKLGSQQLLRRLISSTAGKSTVNAITDKVKGNK